MTSIDPECPRVTGTNRAACDSEWWSHSSAPPMFNIWATGSDVNRHPSQAGQDVQTQKQHRRKKDDANNRGGRSGARIVGRA